jgi:hypothetical protein
LPLNQMRAETLAITSFCLYRNKPAGIWIDCRESQNVEIDSIKQGLI